MKKQNDYFFQFLYLLIVFTFSFKIYAQNEKTNQEDSLKFGAISSINSIQANQDKIEFKNETGNSIITFTDEGGNAGTITLKSVSPLKTAYKFYNNGGTLFWNGSPIADGSGANSINDLSDASSDSSSLFLGSGAGASNSSANSLNTAIGISSLGKNSNGLDNTAIGAFALTNIIGNNNVAVGGSANYYNASGSQNTIIGYQAGYGEIGYGQSGNVFIGHQAGFSELGNNLLYIENSNSSTPLIWGNFADGNEKVIINGDFHVTGNISSSGTGVGASKIDDLDDARHPDRSLFIGFGAGQKDNGTDNFSTSIGYNSLNSNISGEANTAIGYGTLKDNLSRHNTALGYGALNLNVNGEKNTAVGKSALLLSTGSGNVAIGNEAGYNETGDNKLYIENSNSSSPLIWGDFENDIVSINGKFGLGTQDPSAKLHVNSDDGVLFTGTFTGGTFIPPPGAGTRMLWYPEKAAFRAGNVSGFQWHPDSIGIYSAAMGRTTTASGEYSTAFGSQTIARGNYSTSFGSGTIASGGTSTAMGANTKATGTNSFSVGFQTTASGFNSTAIGRGIESSGQYTFAIALNDQNGTIVTQDNTMSVMGGKVGMGTIAPSDQVHIVAGTGQDPFRIQIGSATKFRVFANGGTSIGTNNTGGTPPNGLYVHGDIKNLGGVLHTSDRRFKTKIEPLKNSLQRIDKLNGVYYKWNIEDFPDRGFSTKKQIGLIAQEVEKEFPELVNTDEEGFKSVNYSKLTPILLEGIKQLTRQNTELESRIQKLESLFTNQKFSNN